MSSYGERLMRARKEKELSREELGKLCGITGRTIQNYELGHVTPNRIDVSQRLADVFTEKRTSVVFIPTFINNCVSQI